ncbi:pyridoxamine 5'-phosphate oxidase family protein [Salipiger marinus]|jgi:general stress protein 26|uniref:General stress protein 26 n=1 Tax=Salipiger marinus TaxID=555512 RepID=A0A1G8NXD7_9RHOB|nr:MULTISPECIES: pyridoxamine 5'-phosphate oxidase family protein [Salipiger]MCD1616832.1 pyridoxamine 5'-phosphate oxidase family protein [Salipiger manganoxidans]MEB3420061.1 pyridoxamine 5'-phosphate oxidase family protein [Salipiger manganoxidans]SDI84863.1 General stress protein 26 [Salipiger marinus]
MTKDLKADFWHRLDDVRAGLLGASNERPVPMAPHADKDENAIWFITAKGSAADRAALDSGPAQFYVADAKSHLYATVEGTLTRSDDAAKLDEIWSAMAAAWFKDGRDDNAVQLIRMTPKDAEVWSGDGGVSFLYEIAKANMTGDTPDVGEHGHVTF